ncbi:hypothetical protein [Leifsonia sp. C5G2]|uniref:hypothetical protein n=1 Tax=Leifsonia sp. C5G2 TaxID=2735269 RepID=UPI001584FB28|nr:hypothetical protein [Leifsonia sp. C5G2]NUU05067.1 hypothetical protein [Leifsonia sp. C5G2]
MGVRFSAADSSNLISAMRSNITTADVIVSRLDSGSKHLVAQLDAGVLQGAAFAAGRGLFAELILPGIAKLREAMGDVQAELASYEHAHSVLAKYGNLDHDDLTKALQEAKERLRLIEEQIERNDDFFTQLQAVFTGDVEKLAHQNQALQRLRDQVENEVEDLKEKIDKLEWFVADVAKYFSDSLNVMRLATQAAVELDKVAVEADGSYYANGVDLAVIRGLFAAKISTHEYAGVDVSAQSGAIQEGNFGYPLGYLHQYDLGPYMNDKTPEEIFAYIKAHFGQVFPPAWRRDGSAQDVTLTRVGQVIHTRLADLENEGLTSGDIKVTKLTETSYTIEALPGHPEYPGTVEFTVRAGANGHNFLDVKAGFEKSTPEGWDDAYSLFTGLLWTGYAANLQAAMGHPPLPAQPPQK